MTYTANARKLPSGNYRARAYIGKDENGKPTYKSFTAASKYEAEQAALSYVTQAQEDKSCENIIVKQAFKKYIENKAAMLSPTTVRGYEKITRCDMQGMMIRRVSDLTQAQVQEEFNQECKTKSPKTLRNAHGLLCAVLKEFRPNFVLHTKLPQKVKPDITIPTKEQITTLTNQASPKLRLAILISAYLGLRRSEICALTHADFDKKKHTLSIKKALVKGSDGKWVTKPPKSYAGYRTLPVPDALYAELSELSGNADDHIVKINPDTVTVYWEWLLDKNPQINRFRFHDLRHYNASIMLALNVPNKYAMERLGHATPDMLNRVYQHTMSEKQKEISDNINEYFKAGK